jgi:hypothetical protein
LKKLFILLLGVLLLAACGEEGNEATTPEEEPEQEETNEFEETTELSDTTLETDNYTFVIKEVEQLEGKFDDTQILAVEIEFTNNSDESISPWMASAGEIKAQQETEDTVESLDGANGLYPDDYKTELVEMGDTDVKSGSTVDAVIGYEILYPGEQVKLMDFTLSDEPEKFERNIDTE